MGGKKLFVIVSTSTSFLFIMMIESEAEIFSHKVGKLAVPLDQTFQIYNKNIKEKTRGANSALIHTSQKGTIALAVFNL